MINLRLNRPVVRSIARAVVEIAFIIFLFYANLLMGEFTVTSGRGKDLFHALSDVVTRETFAIALVSAIIGYFVFHGLRKKV